MAAMPCTVPELRDELGLTKGGVRYLLNRIGAVRVGTRPSTRGLRVATVWAMP